MWSACFSKTTFAKKLHRKTGVVIFTIDELMVELFKFKTNKEFQKRYEDTRLIIKKETKKLLTNKKSVILDFGFWKKSDREKIIREANRCGANTIIYYFKSDLATLHKRLDARNKNLSPNTPLIVTHKFLDNFAKEFEPPTKNEAELIIIK